MSRHRAPFSWRTWIERNAPEIAWAVIVASLLVVGMLGLAFTRPIPGIG